MCTEGKQSHNQCGHNNGYRTLVPPTWDSFARIAKKHKKLKKVIEIEIGKSYVSEKGPRDASASTRVNRSSAKAAGRNTMRVLKR
jgi:hypothetical protein